MRKKTFQRDLLYVIADLKAPKGLAVKDELEDYPRQAVPES